MKAVLYISLAIICLFIGLLFLGAYVVFCIAIKSSSGKEVVFGGSHHSKKAEGEKKASFPWLNQVQQVSIKSKDGHTLNGYELFQSASAEWVICIHGYSGNATNMAIYMDHFVTLGYNILSVDLRGHGQSEGKYYGLGYLDQFDIAEWIDYTTGKSQKRQVILFGISMGGATALMTAAYTSANVSKIITDSALADFVSMFTRILYRKLRFLTPLVISVVSLYNRIFAGYWLRDASAVNVVSKVTAPTLFIHGQSDGFVPVSMVEQLHDKCSAPKKRLLIEGADHTKAVCVNPSLYWSTVDDFLMWCGNNGI